MNLPVIIAAIVITHVVQLMIGFEYNVFSHPFDLVLLLTDISIFAASYYAASMGQRLLVKSDDSMKA